VQQQPGCNRHEGDNGSYDKDGFRCLRHWYLTCTSGVAVRRNPLMSPDRVREDIDRAYPVGMQAS
jgi:hypothetical protein